MKHAIIFAGVMGTVLSGGVAYAETSFPADTASYPAYQSDAQTVGTGASAQTFAAGSLKDPNIKLATTKYLDGQATTVNQAVQTLSNTANGDNATVTANTGKISEMESDRQVVPDDPCGNLGDEYIACGYIVPQGTTTTNDDDEKHDKENYNWVKIIATTESVAAANGSSGGSSTL